MPMPTPTDGEARDDFLSRCMGDETMREDFPEEEQRYAVCVKQYDGEERDNALFTFKASIGNVRTETFRGREHLVVPTVMLTEGVLQSANSDVPELALEKEFAPTVPSWNGRPVVVDHPKKNGMLVSANSPDIWDLEVVGHLFNTEVDGKKLKSEAWIDVEKVKEIGGKTLETVEAIQAGEMMEVSTGLFASVEAMEGSYNGEKYSGVWRNILPDHLALLRKGSKGACSIADGCGAPRMNGECQCQEGGECPCKQTTESPSPKSNKELSDIDKRDAIEAALKEKGIDGFVTHLFSTTAIVSEFDDTGHRLMRRPFDITDGVVTIGKGKPVRAETRFYDVKTNQEMVMDKETLVQTLIDNEETPFTEAQRDNLMAFDEETLNGMVPQPKSNEEQEGQKTEETKTEQEPASGPVDLDTLLSNAAPDVRESIEYGRALFNQKKEELVKTITACKRNSFSEDQLRQKPYEELKSIANLVAEEEDYSARGGPRSNSEPRTNVVPEPLSVFD